MARFRPGWGLSLLQAMSEATFRPSLWHVPRLSDSWGRDRALLTPTIQFPPSLQSSSTCSGVSSLPAVLNASFLACPTDFLPSSLCRPIPLNLSFRSHCGEARLIC